jgi:hypothetical protein
MANWYLSDSGKQTVGGQNLATSLWTTVTASATTNAVGSWIQLFTATSFPVDILRLFLGQTGLATSASNTQTLVDIGIGASGSEVAIVNSVTIGGNLPFASLQIPIAIEANTRISVRTRSAVASKACTMGMFIYGGGTGLESGYKATTYGAVTASSRGTVLTAPTATNTEAAWTQITASTTAFMRWLVVGLGMPNTTLVTASDGLLDIGVGAAGSEVAAITDIPYRTTATEDINTAYPLTFPVTIPSGSRLVARYRGTSIAAGAQPNITLTGIS